METDESHADTVPDEESRARLAQTGLELERRAPIRAVLRKVVSPNLRYRVHQLLVENRYFGERYINADPAMAISRVSDATVLVIDGFGRSANTYAQAAFLEANGYDTPVASHRHSPTLIEEGVRRGLPTIVLIRRPRAAIGSGLQFLPDVKPETAIGSWRRYYQRVLPLIDQVLVATFEEVIDDMGAVTRRCNERFGTSFVAYEKTPENEAMVLKTIDEATRLVADPGLEEAQAPRPMASRKSAEEVLAPHEHRVGGQLDRLDALYDEVLRRRTA